MIDFGDAIIGAVIKRTVTLRNVGAEGTKFCVRRPYENVLVTNMNQETPSTSEYDDGKISDDAAAVLPDTVGFKLFTKVNKPSIITSGASCILSRRPYSLRLMCFGCYRIADL